MGMHIQKAKELYKNAEEVLFTKNLTTFAGHDGSLLRISDTYSGVWLEHAYDPVVFASLYPEKKDVAISQARIFFENQKADGQLPALVRDAGDDWNSGKVFVSYKHIQECVSFAELCYETYLLTEDRAFLAEAYAALCRWDGWLCQNRQSQNSGLIETLCEWDTGHDNALRLKGAPHDVDGFSVEHPFLPLLSPDMNAVFYGDRIALSKMAEALEKPEESKAWADKAKTVKEKMFSLLYDEKDQFFYDLDKNGNLRKFKSIHITNVFQEHLLSQEQFDEIYNRYFTDEKEFKTKIPFPALSVSDPNWVQNMTGNSWNFYAEALVALRAERWMPHYGKQADYENLLKVWIEAYTASDLPFGQEFHPMTGKPSTSSPYYSTAMLFFIRAMRHLGLM